jgi:hypothetical protein
MARQPRGTVRTVSVIVDPSPCELVGAVRRKARRDSKLSWRELDEIVGLCDELERVCDLVVINETELSIRPLDDETAAALAEATAALQRYVNRSAAAGGALIAALNTISGALES